LLRKVSGRQFDGATDRDPDNAFVLVDPGIIIQRFLCVFAHGFQLFHALLRPHLFVITSTRHGPNHGEHDYAEQCEEKDYPQPRG
jgi:hypothetical protein